MTGNHISSVQFSHSVVSDSLRSHDSQHGRPLCQLPTPRVHSISCPSSRWWHPAISSSVIHFSSCPNPSQHQGLFQWVSSSHQAAKVLGFQLQHQSNEHPGRISFRMDWLDLLAVQGTLKSLLQHHSSKALIFRCSAFFTVQLSHPYMTTGKMIALTRRTFVGKVMSLLFNMLSRLVITFLPRSESPSAVILEPLQNKVWHCFHCFPIYLPWSDGTRRHDPNFLNVEV